MEKASRMSKSIQRNDFLFLGQWGLEHVFRKKLRNKERERVRMQEIREVVNGGDKMKSIVDA